MSLLRVAVVATLVLLAQPAFANTGASGWVPMDDVGCEVIMGFGHDEASNMIDRCPLTVTQEGDNNSDFFLLFDTIATYDANNPPGRASNTEVFDFDGADDYIKLGVAHVYADEIGEPIAVSIWIAPDTDGHQTIYINYNAIGPVGAKGMALRALDGASLLRSWFIVDSTIAQASFDDILIGNNWSMLGGAFAANAAVLPYGSRCESDSMRCFCCWFDTDGVGDSSVPYSLAGDTSQIDNFAGQMSEFFLFEIPLTDADFCQICRSGYGNDPGNPAEPDDVIFDRWNFCATKPTALGCELPDIPGTSTPATHVGHRRIL